MPSLSKPFSEKPDLLVFLTSCIYKSYFFEVLLPTDDALASWEYC